jgi:phage/plasmid-associated DNA primase
MPSAVENATMGWQQEMDHLKQFVNEQIEAAVGQRVAASRLYDRYTKWCSQHGEQSLTVQAFKAKLQETLDVSHSRIKGCSWWRGIKFRD